MEIKQLLYFVTVSELGSVNQAADKLFTSQPNVSKSLRALETELGVALFERTNKGMQTTKEGRRILGYAENVLKNVDIMNTVTKNSHKQLFGVTSYPSKMMAKIFTDFYQENREQGINMKFLEGSTEVVIDHVEKRETEIGLVYLSDNQKKSFKHILCHKKLSFQCLSERKPCIYAGPRHPYYDREFVTRTELLDLKFVQYKQDYFLLEEHFEGLESPLNEFANVDQVVVTDSNHVMLSMLLESDLCNFGVFFLNPHHKQSELRAIPIQESDTSICLGYLHRKEEGLSDLAWAFIDRVQAFLKETDGANQSCLGCINQ